MLELHSYASISILPSSQPKFILPFSLAQFFEPMLSMMLTVSTFVQHIELHIQRTQGSKKDQVCLYTLCYFALF